MNTAKSGDMKGLVSVSVSCRAVSQEAVRGERDAEYPRWCCVMSYSMTVTCVECVYVRMQSARAVCVVCD